MAARIEDRDRDLDRSAEVAAQGLIAVDGLDDAGLVVEEIGGVEHLVALVPVGSAVKILAAVLGDEINLRPALETVLGRIVVQLHVHFGDSVEVGCVAEIATAAAAVAAVAAIEAVHIERLTPGLPHDGGHAGSETASERILIHALLDARKDAQHRNRIAAAERDHGDLLAVEHRGMGCRRGSYTQALGCDRDRFGNAAHFELKCPKRQPARGKDHVSFALGWAKSLALDANRVGAGHKRRKGEVAGCIGNPDALLAIELIRHLDRGAWD